MWYSIAVILDGFLLEMQWVRSIGMAQFLDLNGKPHGLKTLLDFNRRTAFFSCNIRECSRMIESVPECEEYSIMLNNVHE